MGNAVTNPGRFIEKKILHEQFGFKDPKFPDKYAVPQKDCDNWKQDLQTDIKGCQQQYSYTFDPNGHPTVGAVIAQGKCEIRAHNSYQTCKQ